MDTASETPLHTAKDKGDKGEEQAVRFLEKAGYVVIARKWRTRRGEIDIIAVKGEVLVFAEVKTLPSGCFDTLEHALNTRKQKRIVETSKRFLAAYRQYSKCFIRFDVLVVDMPGIEQVYHIENAFSELV
jgi:putative endonuclease